MTTKLLFWDVYSENKIEKNLFSWTTKSLNTKKKHPQIANWTPSGAFIQITWINYFFVRHTILLFSTVCLLCWHSLQTYQFQVWSFCLFTTVTYCNSHISSTVYHWNIQHLRHSILKGFLINYDKQTYSNTTTTYAQWSGNPALISIKLIWLIMEAKVDAKVRPDIEPQLPSELGTSSFVISYSDVCLRDRSLVFRCVLW